MHIFPFMPGAMSAPPAGGTLPLAGEGFALPAAPGSAPDGATPASAASKALPIAHPVVAPAPLPTTPAPPLARPSVSDAPAMESDRVIVPALPAPAGLIAPVPDAFPPVPEETLPDAAPIAEEPAEAPTAQPVLPQPTALPPPLLTAAAPPPPRGELLPDGAPLADESAAPRITASETASARPPMRDAVAVVEPLLAPARGEPPAPSSAPAPLIAMPAPPPRAAAPRASQAAPSSEPVVRAEPGRLGRNLGVVIERQLRGGEDAIAIRLDPAELGRVHIRLAFAEDGSVRAHIRAEQPQALELLRREAGDLVRTLSDAGLRADPQGLRFEGGSPDREQRHTPPPRAYPSGTERGGADETGEAPPPPTRLSAAAGRLDLLA